LGGIPRFFRTWRKAVATFTWLNSGACVETKSQSSLVSLILKSCSFSSMLNCLLGHCVSVYCLFLSLPWSQECLSLFLSSLSRFTCDHTHAHQHAQTPRTQQAHAQTPRHTLQQN
jgi:hypothetical protein